MNINETTYQSPKVEVIDICAESIICASNVEMGFRSYGEEDDWDE